ncbi:hypothetical protein DEU56DRAFT_778053 [Suillus clintonianus]|uniref:uncharacterized protein n=1 Tax=Suillus clintonianus TaxID=1904413 RepID=UPI001B873BF8|nr:uncharacterized protein DEU56DRAFT_778053 [Suillus clintonianus]KAG2151467.1 hypothetical protein DEU56DRAFT_778053 [Suillus clintonianus]
MPAYDVRDSSIALIGSDLERRVREHAGAKESAWVKAGVIPGFQIWRVEKFAIIDCSDWVAHEKNYGTFYDGESYIVLHTYRPDGKDQALRYDLHFWLGEYTTQDEAAMAAFKAAELDEHLGGKATLYREIQNHESPRYKSYFPHFMILHGGVSTGHHSVLTMLPEDEKKMYTMVTTRHKVLKTRSADGKQLIVREVPREGLVMLQGVVYVLDKGPLFWQFNTKKSTAWARYKSAEYMMYMGQWRVPQAKFQVFDEGTSDEQEFLQAAGITSPVKDVPLPPDEGSPIDPPVLYKLNEDANGGHVVAVAAERTSLQSDGVFILDDHAFPAVYTWLGKNVPEPQRRLALQYAQNYLNDKHAKEGEHVEVATTLVKVNEEVEPASFLEAFNPRTL